MKSWPILYSNLLYKTGQDFLDTQYTSYGKEDSKKYVCTKKSEIKTVLMNISHNISTLLSIQILIMIYSVIGL